MDFIGFLSRLSCCLCFFEFLSHLLPQRFAAEPHRIFENIFDEVLKASPAGRAVSVRRVEASACASLHFSAHAGLRAPLDCRRNKFGLRWQAERDTAFGRLRMLDRLGASESAVAAALCRRSPQERRHAYAARAGQSKAAVESKFNRRSPEDARVPRARKVVKAATVSAREMPLGIELVFFAHNP